MSGSSQLFDDLFDALEKGFVSDQSRLSQEELDRQKHAPDSSSLPSVNVQRQSSPGLRLPAVRPYANGRRPRKDAEAEQKRQWQIVQTANRTAIANESITALNVHGLEVVDRATRRMTDQYYGVKRHEAHSRVMKHMLARCLENTVSGVQAILETHPKRIAEDL